MTNMSDAEYSGWKVQKHCQKAQKLPTKIVVRHLPPTFTLQSFLEHVSPLPVYDYLYFVTGDREDPMNSYSRAYINFLYQKDIFYFKEKYDNYVFLGAKGQEYVAVVEFAPFQKIPKRQAAQKHDMKIGTIQESDYYADFLKNLNNNDSDVSRPEFDLKFHKSNCHDQMTPLLKYVIMKKSEYKRVEKKFEAKNKHDNCIVFVNSAVKKASEKERYKYKFSTRNNR